MKTSERIVIYGLLGVLLVTGLPDLLASWETTAHAEPMIAADPVAPVNALTLIETDGGKNVVLTNHEGRLAWGKSAHDRAYSVAYVFIGKTLNGLMQTEPIREERERLLSELSDRDEEFRDRLDEIRGRGEGMTPESDDFDRTYQEYLAKAEEYRAWQQEALVRRGQLDALHLETAYRELIEAVEVVADRLGIDTVYRFIPTEDPFNADNPEQALLAIRLRTALRYPPELDITDEVMQELSLDLE